MRTTDDIAKEARELRDRINGLGGEEPVTTSELRDVLSDLAGLVHSFAAIVDRPAAKPGRKTKK